MTANGLPLVLTQQCSWNICWSPWCVHAWLTSICSASLMYRQVVHHRHVSAWQHLTDWVQESFKVSVKIFLIESLPLRPCCCFFPVTLFSMRHVQRQSVLIRPIFHACTSFKPFFLVYSNINLQILVKNARVTNALLLFRNFLLLCTVVFLETWFKTVNSGLFLAVD